MPDGPKGANDNSAGTTRQSYDDSQDEYRRARKALAQRVLGSPEELLELLTREPLSLRDRVGLAVHWGIAKNLVTFDREAATAYARQEFSTVAPDLLAAVLGDENGDPEALEELEEHCTENDEPLFATYAERRAYADLRYALQTGYGQAVAIAALDDENDEQYFTPVFSGQEYIALRMLPRLGLIAEEFESRDKGIVTKSRAIPKQLHEAFQPIVELMDQLELGAKVPAWFSCLLGLFQRPLTGADAKDAVRTILSVVIDSTPAVPSVFERGDAEHMRRAIELVRTKRVVVEDDYGQDCDEYGHKIYRPDRPRRGPPLTPWTAAARFAGCFDCLIPREKDAKSRKTDQKRPRK